MMHSLLELLIAIVVALYYCLEHIVLSLVPKRLRYKDISKETVLITGAGSGIGRELAKKFANFGPRLVLVDVNGKGLKETASLLGDASVFQYECDVSKPEMVYQMAAKIKDEVGSVTMLVNNAGVVTGKRFLNCPDESIRKTMDVNIMAHFWTCKAFLPDMVETNHGHIVSVASLAGVAGIPGLVDYCASKYAAVGFEEALRVELYHQNLTGIKTTVVQPFIVQTGLFDGCQVKLIKELETDYVAEKIVSGVLVNQEVIVIPYRLTFTNMLAAIVPRASMRVLRNAVGIFDAMNDFKGRSQTG